MDRSLLYWALLIPRLDMGSKATYNDAATPMVRQYLDIKEQYKDTILFFRLGRGISI
jgi:hypothetical protein